MNKEEAVDLIYQSYLNAKPYQRWENPDRYKRHPEFTRTIIESLTDVPNVLITGSKGKGSVAMMVSELLQTEKRVGLMTSPHITEFNERIRVNGDSIKDMDFIRLISELQPVIAELCTQCRQIEYISPMGIQAILALRYFKEQHTEFQVFECGKGARYDDVNNIPHTFAIINTIFLEHTRELGSTLLEIAEDKASVITGEQKCVYVATQTDEVMHVIVKRAEILGVPVKKYGEHFHCQHVCFTPDGMVFDVVTENGYYKGIKLPLLGHHQTMNCALAIAFAEEALAQFSPEECKKRLKHLNWPGRMELLGQNPMTILDACIHPKSCMEILHILEQMELNDISTILGIPDDKDFLGVAMAMERVSEHLILTRTQNPHYRFTALQKQILEDNRLHPVTTGSVRDAILLAQTYGRPICILGTTALIAEVKQLQKNSLLFETAD